MTPTTYLIHADGSLQAGATPSADWSKMGFAFVLCPSADGRRLYALNPTNRSRLYAYSISAPSGALALTQRLDLPTDPKTFGFPISMTVVDTPK